MTSTTLYDRLGVDPSASVDDLRAAYRRRARELHPDRHGAGATGAEMADLNHAWRVLSDPAARRAYDAGLAPSGHAREADDEVVVVPATDDAAEDWAPWDPEGLDPRGRLLRWLVVVASVVAALAIAALFLYAFLASPQIMQQDEGGAPAIGEPA